MADNHYDHRPAQRAMWAAAYDAMYRWSSMVLGEAVRQAPILVGDLRGSGQVVESLDQVSGSEGGMLAPPALEIPETGGMVELWIVFPKIYAAYQHEGHRADGSHVITQHTDSTSKTKYLEDPIKAHASELMPVMAAAARKALP